MAEELFTRKESAKDVFNIVEGKLKNGFFKDTLPDFDRIMDMDFNYPNLYDNIACVKFWINREEKIESFKTDITGFCLFLDKSYKKFIDFIKLKSYKNDLMSVYAIHHYVYSKIISCLTNKSDIESKEDLRLLAKAFLEIKDFEHGIKAYEYLYTIDSYDGNTLSSLAEIYHKLGDEKKAKMYIRDAIFYDPLDIHFSDITLDVIDELKNVIIKRNIHNKSEEEIILWMSAYGELMNILDVKRPFHDGEETHIRKIISNLEADYRKVKLRILVAPKLLAAYAFLTTFLIAAKK